MTPPNFSFLQKEFPLLHNLAAAAEYNLYIDLGALVNLPLLGEREAHGIRFALQFVNGDAGQGLFPTNLLF